MVNESDGAHLIETTAERSIREQREENRRAGKYRKLQLWFNAILTIATIVTAGIALYQNYVLGRSLAEMKTQSTIMNETFHEMQKQTQPMIDAADAASGAVAEAESSRRLAKQAMDANIVLARTEQRAWIGRTALSKVVIEVGKPFEVKIEFKNSGATPALNVRVSANLEPVSLGARPTFQHQVQPKSREVVLPNHPLYSTIVSPDPNKFPTGLNQAGVTEIISGSKTAYIYGVVCYSDVFDVDHWTSFCNVLNPKTKEFEVCPTGNDVDREGKRYHPVCEVR